ncbi:MAG: hypothetical protein ACOH2H_19970 [Cypionkella sp.]
MAEYMTDDGHRRTELSELRRVVGPFHMDEHAIGNGDRISLATMADTPNVFLDGNVYSATVNLVASRLMPYTGTRWQLRLNGDETWSFLNQGQAEQMLAGSGSIVTLGREPLGGDAERFNTTRWLLYRDLAGFRLRPCMRVGGWLGVRDGQAVLSSPSEPAGRWLYWIIKPYGTDE